MHALIEGVLQYSRIGRVKEAVTEFSVTELLDEVIEFIGTPDTIKVTYDTDLPVIRAERVRIFQLFQNLLSNSVKFMDKDHGYILISCIEQGAETLMMIQKKKICLQMLLHQLVKQKHLLVN